MIMPDVMTSTYEKGGRVGRPDVLGVQRRRRWTPEEKSRIVEETYLPGHSVSLIARRHGIAANQLFAWRRLMAQGALTAAGAARMSGQRRSIGRLRAKSANSSACSARRRWRTRSCARP